MRQMRFSELDWDEVLLRIDGDGYPLHALTILPDSRGTPFIDPRHTPPVPDERYVILGPGEQRLCQVHVSNYEKQDWWAFERALDNARDRRQATTILEDRLGHLQNFADLHGVIEYLASPGGNLELAARSCLRAFQIQHPNREIMFANYLNTPVEDHVSVLILYRTANSQR